MKLISNPLFFGVLIASNLLSLSLISGRNDRDENPENHRKSASRQAPSLSELQSELDRLENLVKDLKAKKLAMNKPGILPQNEFEAYTRVFDELLEAEIQAGMTKIKIEIYERQ